MPNVLMRAPNRPLTTTWSAPDETVTIAQPAQDSAIAAAATLRNSRKPHGSTLDSPVSASPRQVIDIRGGDVNAV
jgi:hypothetical protein